MSVTGQIARMLGVTWPQAKAFCLKVQHEFKEGRPPFKVIADAVRQHPNETPGQIARIISPELIYAPSPEQVQRDQPVRRERREPQRSTKATRSRSRLVRDLADLMPGEERTDKERANQFLAELQQRYPRSEELSNSQLLSAIRRACKADILPMDRVVYEVRREVEGISRDPELVAGLAALLPGEDKGHREVAQQFLLDLERRYPQSARLSNERLLHALERACRKGSLGVGRAMLEVRKERHGGDPCWISVVSIPTGGQPKR